MQAREYSHKVLNKTTSVLTVCQGGMYVRLSNPAARRDRTFLKDAEIGELFHPRDHFELLLKHDQLMLAVDAIEVFKRQKTP